MVSIQRVSNIRMVSVADRIDAQGVLRHCHPTWPAYPHTIQVLRLDHGYRWNLRSGSEKLDSASVPIRLI